MNQDYTVQVENQDDDGQEIFAGPFENLDEATAFKTYMETGDDPDYRATVHALWPSSNWEPDFTGFGDGGD